MSKSLKRVIADAERQGLNITVQEMTVDTHTAAQAAQAVGCHIDQIAKSIIFKSEDTGQAILFLTAGGNRVDADKAALVAGQNLGKADAALIRAQTGFAIGGVSPIGHLNPIECYVDKTLVSYPRIWAAAGTPRHMFEIAPDVLIETIKGQLADFT